MMASAMFSFSSSNVAPWEMASGICSHWPVYHPFLFFPMMIAYSMTAFFVSFSAAKIRRIIDMEEKYGER